MLGSFANRGELWVMAWPWSLISPVSGRTAPVIILFRVDLPAPFSPISACTSPAYNSNEACWCVCAPAYGLVISGASSKTWSLMVFGFDYDDVQLHWPVDTNH